MQNDKLENASFLVLFIGISILLFFVFAPFFAVMALAAVSAVLLHPAYEKLAKLFKGEKNIAAAVTVGLLLVFIIVPLFFLGIQIFTRHRMCTRRSAVTCPIMYKVFKARLNIRCKNYFPDSFLISNRISGTCSPFISANLESLIYKTFSVIFDTFLMLLALFFFLRDGDDMLASFARVNPLGKDLSKEIFDTMYKTIGAVMKGTLVNALIRWAAISIAFYLFGIPNAILWGCLGGIIGAIPGLGTPFAFVPAVAYLYLQGNMLAALGLAVVGIAIIILVDNMLTSYFFGKGLLVAPIFILFSLFGGIVFFGRLDLSLATCALSISFRRSRVSLSFLDDFLRDLFTACKNFFPNHFSSWNFCATDPLRFGFYYFPISFQFFRDDFTIFLRVLTPIKIIARCCRGACRYDTGANAFYHFFVSSFRSLFCNFFCYFFCFCHSN